MSDQIKALAPQFWEMTPHGLQFNQVRFAEAIIRECVRVCVADVADPRDSIELECAKKIKNHFGVE